MKKGIIIKGGDYILGGGRTSSTRRSHCDEEGDYDTTGLRVAGNPMMCILRGGANPLKRLLMWGGARDGTTSFRVAGVLWHIL